MQRTHLFVMLIMGAKLLAVSRQISRFRFFADLLAAKQLKVSFEAALIAETRACRHPIAKDDHRHRQEQNWR